MPPELTLQQALRYSRQVSLPSVDLEGQEALIGSKVLVLGLGGLGCAAAQYLAAAGIGHLVLCDFDDVDLSNLQRQVLHQESDVGTNKAESASQSLKAINSELTYTVIPKKLTKDELVDCLAQCDVALDCTDNLEARNTLNEACLQTSTPLVSGAAIRIEGQVINFKSDGESACYQCLSSLFNEQELSCVEAGILSPVVGMIGSSQALSTIKIIADIPDVSWAELAMFDGQTGKWQHFTVPRNPDCPACNPKNEAQ